MLFLHVGIIDSSGSVYPAYSGADIDLFTKTTDYIITFNGSYSIYGEGTNGRYTSQINSYIVPVVQILVTKNKPFYIGFPGIQYSSGRDYTVDHNLPTNASGTKALYQSECSAFAPALTANARPFVAYCGSRNTQVTLKNAVNQLYTSGTSYY